MVRAIRRYCFRAAGIERTIVPDSARIFEFLDKTMAYDDAHQFCADKSDECVSACVHAVRYGACVRTPTDKYP